MLNANSFREAVVVVVLLVGSSAYGQPIHIPAGVDLFITEPACQSVLTRFVDTPIPADFFGPGSDPFQGTVILRGYPLNTNPPGVLDPVDAIIERLSTIDLSTTGEVQSVPIELLALSLIGCDPITVEYDGGTTQEEWQIDISLSSLFPQQQGILTLQRECPTGGTYTAELPVRPRFIFTRVNPPSSNPPYVIDDGSVINLAPVGPQPWSISLPVSPFVPILSDGLTLVDHDVDPVTPEILLPASSGLFLGMRDLPCDPTLPVQCQAAQPATWTWDNGPRGLVYTPSVSPNELCGAACLPDNSCVVTDASCAELVGAEYHGDGVPCQSESCAPTTLPGLAINQVDFTFDLAAVTNSRWGRLDVDVSLFVSGFTNSSGFVNIQTDLGWVVQNLWIDDADDVDHVTTYFTILDNDYAEVSFLSAYVAFDPNPQVTFLDGPRLIYSVTPVEFNAEGGGEQQTTLTTEPLAPNTIVFDFLGITEVLSQPNKSNVQAAKNQCFPMSIANSLQYLENRYGLPVPHHHGPGRKGDTTLVGQLDTESNRATTARDTGSGVWFVPMVNGKFKYLKDNGLDKKVIQKHQGPGYGGAGNQLPAGDYTNNGVTSKDESVNGKVTWQWICDELAKGEDVEIVYSFDSAGIPKGGHAVRVFECGRTLGVPWIGYVHDRQQTNRDPGDSLGLESVRQWAIDTDGDTLLNLGADRREIRFAFSESADTDRDSVTNGQDNAPGYFNPGQEDLDDNGIGDVAESGDLVVDEIPSFDMAEGDVTSFGPFPNPAPPSGTHKDMWYWGEGTASNGSPTRIIVSFDYVNGDGIEVIMPSKDTTIIPAGQSREVFGSVTLDFCPEQVSVHFETLDGPALSITGDLRHICYSPLDITCCIGLTMGNIDCEGIIDIGDVTSMIQNLFITLNDPCCEAEADIDQSGLVDIGDLTMLISSLFITLNPLPACP